MNEEIKFVYRYFFLITFFEEMIFFEIEKWSGIEDWMTQTHLVFKLFAISNLSLAAEMFISIKEYLVLLQSIRKLGKWLPLSFLFSLHWKRLVSLMKEKHDRVKRTLNVITREVHCIAEEMSLERWNIYISKKW